MKRRFVTNILIKFRATLIFTLITVFMLGTPANVESRPLYQYQLSNYELYLRAFNFANNKDYVQAYVHLFAYVQRNPPEYANNVDGLKMTTDKNLDYFLGETQDSIADLNRVKADIALCGRFPCSGDATLLTTHALVRPSPLQPLPDVAIVCTKPNYKGICKILFVGSYSTHQSLGVPNDSIASVMVGSRVKITLYANALGDSPMITLTQNDPDLGDNLEQLARRYT